MQDFDTIKSAPSFAELRLEKAINGVIIHPSSVCNPTLSPSGLTCPRSAAFKLKGATARESEETYESGIAAAMGSFIHERIQFLLRNDEIYVDVEDFIKEHPELGLSVRPIQKHAGEVSLYFSGVRNGKKVSPPFSFQCDGIVRIDGKYYLVEIKSESEKAWQARTAPNPGHQKQGIAYSFLYGIEGVLWVYASRESFGMHRKVYLQTIPQEKVDALVSYVQDIGDAVEKDDIKRLPKVKDCRYCAFIDICKVLD